MHNPDTAQVTVIGLGAMGSTLARAFLNSGRRVIVWNRTASRAEEMASRGAIVAATAAEAIASSHLTVMCVLDYVAADAIMSMKGVNAALRGRTLAQLSSGQDVDARQMGERVQETILASRLRWMYMLMALMASAKPILGHRRPDE
jgi:3-hydroxyisobutyrate dehydrogenase-like beta-hydroxyacid dehydrogenase